MQDLTSTTTAQSTLPFSPLTECGLAIQINQRASFLTYQTGAGQALNPAVVAEAQRVYDMCRAHTSRVLATLEFAHVRIGDGNAVRQALADHFVMWHELDDIAGPSGEWRCSCGLKFGFSDSAIDHVAERAMQVIAEAATAIQGRINLIRATAPDVVPGGYQTAFADGLTSAIAEVRHAVYPSAQKGSGS